LWGQNKASRLSGQSGTPNITGIIMGDISLNYANVNRALFGKVEFQKIVCYSKYHLRLHGEKS
jgi:hypothetical protein